MGVKTGFSHYGKNAYQGCLREDTEGNIWTSEDTICGWAKVHEVELHRLYLPRNINC
jgi:hypothetical protein